MCSTLTDLLTYFYQIVLVAEICFQISNRWTHENGHKIWIKLTISNKGKSFFLERHPLIEKVGRPTQLTFKECEIQAQFKASNLIKELMVHKKILQTSSNLRFPKQEWKCKCFLIFDSRCLQLDIQIASKT